MYQVNEKFHIVSENQASEYDFLRYKFNQLYFYQLHMDLSLSMSNGILVCSQENHGNEPIIMIDVGEGVNSQEKLLCLRCFESKRQISKYISIKEAQKLIEEKLIQTRTKVEETQQIIIKDLVEFSKQILDVKTKIFKHIDEILGVTQQWISDIKKVGITSDITNFLSHIELLKSNDFGEIPQALGFVQINTSHFQKIISMLEKLGAKENYQNCYNFLKSRVQNNNDKQLCEQTLLTNQIQNLENKDMQYKSIRYSLIGNLKQEEWASAMAFNHQGSIMVAGFYKDIKVWKFEKGKLKEKMKLNGHTYNVTCIIFSKMHNWFASGSLDSKIRCWKEEINENWECIQSEKLHSQDITCLLLNQLEDEIISSSSDFTIKVWKVNCLHNQLEYNYTLDKGHIGGVSCISLNETETFLVSCGEDHRIILWNKKSNKLWAYQNEIDMDDQGKRISFISENLIAWQQYSKGITHIFEQNNGELIKRLDLKLELNQERQDELYFPTIVNKSKSIIIQKHSRYVYILVKQRDRKLQIATQPINCSNKSNYGALTEDGQYLTIWDKGTHDFSIYQIIYE